ncbi:reverse transcriptase zinc-binding domain-containing protein [Tanacetum coccineum]
MWPTGGTNKFPILLNVQNVKLDMQSKDKIMWKRGDGKLCRFTVTQTYKDLLPIEEEVEWWKVMWFSQNIPKHAFILWLAVLNKLTTQDKIKKWGSYDVMCCPLCKQDSDSHGHLFFECEYSKVLWNKLLKMIDVDWRTNMSAFARSYNGNSINSIIRRLCIAASVYLIWQERNNRIFRDEEISSEDLYKVLYKVVRLRILSLRVKDIVAVRKVQEIWNVKMCIQRNLVN